jgi:hypothetical protein
MCSAREGEAMKYGLNKLKDAEDALDRVRKLHYIDDYNNRCNLCANHGDYENPCKTIKVLEEKQ